MNTSPVYNDKYIKTQLRTYTDKVYTNLHGLNVPQDHGEPESFTIISIDSLLACESKCYLQVYLDNLAYKIVDTQMIDYLDNTIFKSDNN